MSVLDLEKERARRHGHAASSAPREVLLVALQQVLGEPGSLLPDNPEIVRHLVVDGAKLALNDLREALDELVERGALRRVVVGRERHLALNHPPEPPRSARAVGPDASRASLARVTNQAMTPTVPVQAIGRETLRVEPEDVALVSVAISPSTLGWNGLRAVLPFDLRDRNLDELPLPSPLAIFARACGFKKLDQLLAISELDLREALNLEPCTPRTAAETLLRLRNEKTSPRDWRKLFTKLGRAPLARRARQERPHTLAEESIPTRQPVGPANRQSVVRTTGARPDGSLPPPVDSASRKTLRPGQARAKAVVVKREPLVAAAVGRSSTPSPKQPRTAPPPLPITALATVAALEMPATPPRTAAIATVATLEMPAAPPRTAAIATVAALEMPAALPQTAASATVASPETAAAAQRVEDSKAPSPQPAKPDSSVESGENDAFRMRVAIDLETERVLLYRVGIVVGMLVAVVLARALAAAMLTH